MNALFYSMKTFHFSRSALFALALIAAPFGLRAASEFQGQIDMQVSNPKKPNESMVMHYTLKDRKIRFDMPNPDNGRSKGAMFIIVDYDTREMDTLIDSGEQKILMKRTLPDQQALAQNGQSSGQSMDNMHVPVATGKTETILGYSASEYKIVDKKGEEVDMWLAKGLGNFMSANSAPSRRGGSGVSPEWEAFARNAGLFPMRVVTHDKGGKETMKMEVVRIDKSPVPDSAFSTEGYQEIKMPSLGGLFGH